MSEKETKSTIGPDGLLEFGQYLTSLQGINGYQFEVELDNKLQEKTLDEVIGLYEEFLASRQDRFRVRITHCNYAANTINATDKVITRRKP